MTRSFRSLLRKPLRCCARAIGRIRWIRFGLRDRLARLVENPDRTPGHWFDVPFYGGIYSGTTASFLDWSVFYFGAYSFEELALFSDFANKRNNLHVLDVGANVGHHSLFYALQGAEVISIEPNPIIFKDLQKRCLAHPNLRIMPLRLGLSDSNNAVELSLPDGANRGTASMQRKVGSSVVEVIVRLGDELLKEQGITKVDFIKIDVEYHEEPVLLGLAETLATFKPVVFFEWNSTVPIEKIQFLFPSGYKFYQFNAYRTIAFFFNQPRYRLKLLEDGSFVKPGNYLAATKLSAKIAAHT